MYNFELIKDEELIKIFDDIYIKQNENEKTTTIILTNKRLLFLEHKTPNEGLEVLRITRGTNYIKIKDVYYQVNLEDILNIIKEENYQVILRSGMIFEFNNDELYNLLLLEI